VTILELADGVDDQLVLDAARTAGPVREFRRVTPTLTELFREAVSQPSSPATVTPSEVHA
jgi:ABC-2 type transport system ATP-binding protein